VPSLVAQQTLSPLTVNDGQSSTVPGYRRSGEVGGGVGEASGERDQEEGGGGGEREEMEEGREVRGGGR
jgi:hypothetical protein